MSGKPGGCPAIPTTKETTSQWRGLILIPALNPFWTTGRNSLRLTMQTNFWPRPPFARDQSQEFNHRAEHQRANSVDAPLSRVSLLPPNLQNIERRQKEQDQKFRSPPDENIRPTGANRQP